VYLLERGWVDVRDANGRNKREGFRMPNDYHQDSRPVKRE
jgi:hypothetical protein